MESMGLIGFMANTGVTGTLGKELLYILKNTLAAVF
jgi:hypothetical protein